MSRFLSAALILGLTGLALAQNARAGHAGIRAGWIPGSSIGLARSTPALDMVSAANAGNTGNAAYLRRRNVPRTGQAADGSYRTVSFSNASSSAGSPAGTILVARGNDANGQINYASSLAQGSQVSFPEPMSLTLFGTGLLGIALMVRRRTQRVSTAGAKASSGLSDVGSGEVDMRRAVPGLLLRAAPGRPLSVSDRSGGIGRPF